MDDVYGDYGGDGVGGVFSGGEDAGSGDESYFAGEVVFEGGREAEDLARAGVEKDAGGGIGEVVSRDSGVVLVAVDGVAGKNPVAGDAVFGGEIDEERGAGTGVAAESLGGAVDADILHAGAVGERLGDVEAGAEDAAVGHPEKSLGVEAERGGVGAGAEGVVGVVAELIVFSDWKCLLHIDGCGGQPTAFVKEPEAILRLHVEIADFDAGAAESLADFVVAEDRNRADGEFVEEAVVEVGEGSELVGVWCTNARAARVVEALWDDVVEIRLDEDVALRQRVGGGREERAGPPGIGHCLAIRLGLAISLASRLRRGQTGEGEQREDGVQRSAGVHLGMILVREIVVTVNRSDALGKLHSRLDAE